MTKRRLTNYFEDTLEAPQIVDFILADLPANYVPTALSALETRKGRSFWLTRDDWLTALQAISLFQQRLLMDATDRIVNEVRALRDGQLTPPEARDPQADPYTLPLTALTDINSNLQFQTQEVGDRLDTANNLLVEIRDAVLAQGGNPEDIIGRLDTLIFLLGAL